YSIFVVLGAVTRSNQHIRVGFVLEWLVGERKAQRIWTTLENVIGLGLTAFLAYTAVRWAAESHATGEKEFTHFIENFYSVWIIKVMPAVGICLLSFFYFERCARQLLSYISSRSRTRSAGGDMVPDSTNPENEAR
ncbi:MAG: TRAP transporter small permease subunit, partial [Dehalococcoidia bacterium]